MVQRSTGWKNRCRVPAGRVLERTWLAIVRRTSCRKLALSIVEGILSAAVIDKWRSRLQSTF